MNFKVAAFLRLELETLVKLEETHVIPSTPHGSGFLILKEN